MPRPLMDTLARPGFPILPPPRPLPAEGAGGGARRAGGAGTRGAVHHLRASGERA